MWFWFSYYNIKKQGNQVVWYGGVEDENVYLFDGSSTTAITTSGVNRIPQIDGSNIIWQYGTPAPNQEIFWYDGSGTTNITSDSIPDRRPDISGDYIVWDSYRNDNWQIMAYNVSTDNFTQITTSDWSNNRPKIDGTDLIWYGDAGGDWNIYYKKLGSSDPIQNISPLSTQNRYFEICDGYAVWTGWDGTDFEIYIYSVADDITQVITDNAAEDTYPQTDGKTIVWYGWDGTDFEIYIYDILEQTIEQITDNDYDDLHPYVSDGTVAWYGWDGTDYEIFTAQETVPIPEPASLLLMFSGLISIAIKRILR